MMKELFGAVTLAAALTVGLNAQAQDQEKVLIGTEGAYPPFNYIDSDGELAGFDVEIAKALCDAANFNCEFVVQDWDGIIPGLLAKKYDAIIASMSITEERKEVVDFTDKYYQTPAKFVKPEDMDLEIPEDIDEAAEVLDGMTVGVQRATIHENFLKDNFPNVDLSLYASQEEANLDLTNGRVDLVMADSVVLLEGFLNQDEGADYEFVGPDYSEKEWHGEGVGIAVRPGEDELLEAFNEAIAEIRENGTYKEINDKYFDFDAYGS
ncbi:ABC transporter substrate-binding protein [Fodinicurvata sediminis]|uniref:ABC transporter substrate-binding protein n=1 Tax=Fodinicurvata sediminis TaxID=1121832 RepID=UPI0003B5F2FD|nr:ABC transporter substrate-binding protein [Fodinicurvata sediminis]